MTNAQSGDPIGTFDPYLAAINNKTDSNHYRCGYFLWPNPRKAEAADIKIMTIGNSTSLWPDADWSQRLGKLLNANGYDVGIFHGAGKGNTSSQELLRVIRDGAAIRPDLIISLSGICDIGFLLNSRNYPYAHKYIRRTTSHLVNVGLARDAVYGYPDTASPSEVWCRNQSLANLVANALGALYRVFLQPVMGFGDYTMNEEETRYYALKSPVVLKAINKPYGECVSEFYTDVRRILTEDPHSYRHIIDFVDIFSDCPAAYRDHRHQSEIGVEHLARSMLPYIIESLSPLIPRNSLR